MSRSHARSGRPASPHRRASGQAIIEFLVAALVLIPLFLLMPLIGKYLDIKQTTIAASRKLAFECTVRYADCANLGGNPSFADEIRMRFFSGDQSPVLSNDYPAQDAIAQGEGDHLWVDNEGRPLLENYSDVGIKADASDLNTGFVGNALKLGPEVFDLQLAQGLYDARVQIDLSPKNGGADFLDQLNSLALKMQFHTAIMTNAWTANGPGASGDKCNAGANTVIGRVSQASLCLLPYKVADVAYAPASLVIQPLVTLMGESNGNKFNFHDFESPTWIDEVPETDPLGFPRTSP